MIPINQYYEKSKKNKNPVNEPETVEIPVKKEVQGSVPNAGQTITIQSVRIDFPVKPYPAQIQIMNKIIDALNKKENALLESPTGSGKSLALLCSALAWRENQIKLALDKIARESGELDEVINLEQKPQQDRNQELKTSHTKKAITTHVETIRIDGDDDFQTPITKKFVGRIVQEEAEPQGFLEDDEGITVNRTKDKRRNLEKLTPEDIKRAKMDVYKQVPRIFIGSRTHRQIAQLISELKNKTRYRPQTAVLGSREHLCIHTKVKKSLNKTDDCTNLLDQGKCSYAKKAHKILTHHSLKTTNRVWDIEDIVNLGKVTGGCPYYASIKIFEAAEVIFCPYNYIVDPVIRKIMDINLKNSIVILDEAHNIEDSSRSAGSFDLEEQTMDILMKELSLIIRRGFEVNAHNTLELVVGQLYNLMTSTTNHYTVKEYEKESCHFTGKELLEKLNRININKNTFESALLPAYKKVVAHAELIRKEMESKTDDNKNLSRRANQDGDYEVRLNGIKAVSNGSLTVLQGIFMVLGFLCDPNQDFSEHYEMVLMKIVDRQSDNPANKKRKTTKQNTPRSMWKHKLAFWCLNPAVVFQNMCQDTHSVILASGTLSPLHTFASELGTDFSGKLEANHVIKPSQVWAKAVPFGPNRLTLKGVYQNIESFQYQDEIGECLYKIVQTVPYGILCFMPSYKALDLMVERWKLTGVLDRIKEKKLVILEPNGKDKNQFEESLNQFYQKIDLVECGANDVEGQDGALLFAVFRGKVSEGIDFSDNYCRAVVSLGIPYPGVKDLEVKLKKDYNNRRTQVSKQGKYLTGSAWYYAQAFRAINQALGRCIRHKNDWGAIILLEERFTNAENANGLSKWIQKLLRIEDNFQTAMESLSQFVDRQTKETERLKMERRLVLENEIIMTNLEAEKANEDSPSKETTPIYSPHFVVANNDEKVELSKSKPEVVVIDDSFTEDVSFEDADIEDMFTDDIASEDLVVGINITETAADKKQYCMIQEKENDCSIPYTENISKESLSNPKIPLNNISINTIPQTQIAKSVKNSQAFPSKPVATTFKKDLTSDQPFPSVAPHGYARLACKYCKAELFRGPNDHAHLKNTSEIVSIAEDNNIDLVIELEKPSIWEVSNQQIKGALEIHNLPASSNVVFNRVDNVCYTPIYCKCNNNQEVGLLICMASHEKRNLVGRVYLNEKKITKIAIQPPPVISEKDLEAEIPNSQYSSTDDIFYNL